MRSANFQASNMARVDSFAARLSGEDGVDLRTVDVSGGPNDGYIGREADWREGLSLWTQDYPRADRHFVQAVRRLTRIQVRSVEQPVNLTMARSTTGHGYTPCRRATGS